MPFREILPDHKRFVALVTILGMLFIVGTVGFYFTPLEVRRTYNLTTTTADGLSITYDVFESNMKQDGVKKAVILGHGIMVNKEVMKLTAIELARQGFVAVCLNFRGHGLSDGDFSAVTDTLDLNPQAAHDIASAVSFGALALDIQAVKENYLAAREDINMTHLGYVGYSMGGGAGFAALENDTDFVAMVGMAPVPDYLRVNTTCPRNLCIVIGKYDQAIPIGDVYKVMENKTGVDRSEITNELMNARAWEFEGGSFADGTAARLYVDPLGEHFLSGWNPNLVRETRDWMVRALKEEIPRSITTSYAMLMTNLVIQLIGGIGLFFLLAGRLLTKFAVKPDRTVFPREILERETPSSLTRGITVWAILLALPCMVFVIPLYFAPLVITAFNLMFLLGPSFAIMFFLLHLGKENEFGVKQIYSSAGKSTGKRNIVLGLGLGVIFWGILEISIGQIFSLLPGLSKWPWVPLYFVATFFAFFNFILFYQPLLQEKIQASGWAQANLKAGIINYLMVLSMGVFILLPPCLILQNYFIWMYIWVVLLMLLASTGIGTMFYSKTKDPILAVLTMSVFICLMFCTLSPIIWVVNFF